MFNFLAKVLLVFFIFFIVAVIYKSLQTEGYVVEAISVPKGINESGYDSQVLANLLQDELDLVKRVAGSSKEDSIKVNSQNSKDLKIDVMGLGFSTSTLSYHIRELFGIETKTIKGQLTHIDDELRMIMRITNEETKTLKEKIPDEQLSTALDTLMRSSAEHILYVTDPYRLAVYYKSMNKLDKSVEIIRYIINGDGPDKEWAYLLWGNLNSSGLEPNKERAIECYEKAMAINPDFKLPAFALGWLYFGMKDFDNAVTYFNIAIKQRPKHFGINNGLAISYRRLGNQEKALFHYEQNVENHPENLWSYGNYSDYKLRELKDTIGATNLFKKAASHLDESADYYVALSGMYYFQNKLDSALFVMDKALEIDPENISALYQVASYHASDEEDADHQLADKYFERIVSVFDKKDVEMGMRQNAYNQWAMNKYKQSKFDEAFEKIRKAISYDASSAYPWTTMAEIHHYKGDVDSFYYYCNKAKSLGFEFKKIIEEEPYSDYKDDAQMTSLLAIGTLKN